MCGISGIIELELSPVKDLAHCLKVMNDIQAHRGPDGQAHWTNASGCVGLAHQRLSIIDLETGNQPMADEYGRTITYNGEIYNYIELRNELKSFYKFKTTSDTEVILAAYAKWGKDCVNKLRGMFAFVIWDEKEKTALIARDRFGIKPFYYTIQKNTFILHP